MARDAAGGVGGAASRRIEADERLNGLATNLREELLSAAALVDVVDGEVR
jgi:hypothetical protein